MNWFSVLDAISMPRFVDIPRSPGLQAVFRHALESAALLVILGPWAKAQEARELRAGHWIEVKGEFDGETFVASGIEVLEPEKQESLIGTATEVDRGAFRFTVLGQPVEFSAKTDWRKVTEGDLEGRRVKVEGYWRGPSRLSSRSIAERPPGRDRITGRLDAIERVPGGHELHIMRFLVFLPDQVAVEAERPLSALELAPQRTAPSVDRRRDEDDYVPGTIALGRNLNLGLRAEWDSDLNRDYDLDDGLADDRLTHELALRGELTWLPTPRFYGLMGFRASGRAIDDEDRGYTNNGDLRLSEAFGYFRNLGLDGLDVQLGRQDFDDEREWLYDQNMDALRLIWSQRNFRAELSASTNLTDNSRRDRHSDNLIAYVSNNDPERKLAAYIIDRRTETFSDRDKDYPLHFGVRAMGEWLPQSNIWLEYSQLHGYRGFTDYDGYGYDLGATLTPDLVKPWYFSFGWAFGSGDDDPTDGVDHAFRQSGMQDNNAKLGGVTSFRYYGELVDPQLSNLSILTVGVGRRFGRRASVDLVWHKYAQDELSDRLLDTDLDMRPSGVDRDLGWELDLVFGRRGYKNMDLEFILGTFEPGDAFPQAHVAWLVALQARLRL